MKYKNIFFIFQEFAKVCKVCDSIGSTTPNINSNTNDDLNDPQVLLALCLKGVECDDSVTCSKAQILCLGETIYNNYNHEQRKGLSECYVDHYICALNTTNNCNSQLQTCLERKAAKYAQAPITIEDIISQVADDIIELVTDADSDPDG